MRGSPLAFGVMGFACSSLILLAMYPRMKNEILKKGGVITGCVN